MLLLLYPLLSKIVRCWKCECVCVEKS